LKDYFVETGLKDVESFRTRPPPDLLKPYTQMVFILYLEHAALHDAAGNFGKGDELRKLVDQCAGELNEGGTCSHLLQIVIGRKNPCSWLREVLLSTN